MGKPGAFLQQSRVAHTPRPVAERVRDFDELYTEPTEAQTRVQASRCMNCGVAFCQTGVRFGAAKTSGCPLHNLIPECNDLVYRGLWADAAARLSLTNPLPEFTSRVCPAPCEAACNLGRNHEAETIHDNERAISDWEWANGGPRRFDPVPPDAPGVCVVGSGPAGLSLAWDLTRRGARVCVVERADRAGGLLTYGIPNMKLPKDVVSRRIDLMMWRGIEFRCGVDAAKPEVAAGLMEEFDAVVLAVGATVARDIPATDFKRGLQSGGVLYAVDYLSEATRALLEGRDPKLSARGLDVVVVGGGDTGNDCMGMAVRQGARTVRQLAHGKCPPARTSVANCWPEWPRVLETAYGQEEAAVVQGADLREWECETKAFHFDDAGKLCGIEVEAPGATAGSRELRTIDTQLVLVACGFTGPEQAIFDAFGVARASEGKPVALTVGNGHLLQRASAEEGDFAAHGEEALCDRQGTDAPEGKLVNAPANALAGKFAGKFAGKLAGERNTLDTPLYIAGDARMGATLVVSTMADALACAEEVAKRLQL